MKHIRYAQLMHLMFFHVISSNLCLNAHFFFDVG